MKPIAAPSASWSRRACTGGVLADERGADRGPHGSGAIPEAQPTNGASGAQSMQPMLDRIRADAAQRAGVALDQVKVLTVESVTWSDGSLGCPEPGMMYTQALVRGYRIRVDAAGTTARLPRGHAEHVRALPAGARAGAVARRSDLIAPRSATSGALTRTPKENAPGIVSPGRLSLDGVESRDPYGVHANDRRVGQAR